jgi:putative NADPH-quinone reductase
MKKALIIFVHPEPRSLNGYLKDIAARVLEEQGYSVTVSDLYGEHFKPLFDKSDYPFYNKEVFSPGKANGMAMKLNQLAPDVRREKERLEEADLVLFQFPVWWFSCPSMLHAYFERVFLPGWADFTDKPALDGKKAVLSVTTGGKKENYVAGAAGTIGQALHHLLAATLVYVKMQVLEPIVMYEVLGLSDEERADAIRKFEEEIRNIENRPFFNHLS